MNKGRVAAMYPPQKGLFSEGKIVDERIFAQILENYDYQNGSTQRPKFFISNTERMKRYIGKMSRCL